MGLLLKVEERFQIRGRGVVLEPGLPVEFGAPQRLSVRLVRPDGTERTTQAVVEYALASGPNLTRREWCALVLPGLTKEDVPIGTEVFVV